MKLKDYLKNRDRKEFAARIGVSYGYLRLLVSGHKVPSSRLAVAIRDSTNGEVSIDELLDSVDGGAGTVAQEEMEAEETMNAQ